MPVVPRSGITQGCEPDGTVKLRAVDHFSWSYSHGSRKRKRQDIKSGSVNGHYVPDTVMKHDHLDDLMASMKFHHETTSQAR